MRNLFIIGLMVGGAFMAGWFTVNRDGDRTTIEINRSEIRQDTRRAIDRGRQYLDQHQQAQQNAYPDQGYEQQGYGPNQGYPPAADYNQQYASPNQYGGQPQPGDYRPGYNNAYGPDEQIAHQPQWQPQPQPQYGPGQGYPAQGQPQGQYAPGDYQNYPAPNNQQAPQYAPLQ